MQRYKPYNRNTLWTHELDASQTCFAVYCCQCKCDGIDWRVDSCLCRRLYQWPRSTSSNMELMKRKLKLLDWWVCFSVVWLFILILTVRGRWAAETFFYLFISFAVIVHRSHRHRRPGEKHSGPEGDGWSCSSLQLINDLMLQVYVMNSGLFFWCCMRKKRNFAADKAAMKRIVLWFWFGFDSLNLMKIVVKFFLVFLFRTRSCWVEGRAALWRWPTTERPSWKPSESTTPPPKFWLVSEAAEYLLVKLAAQDIKEFKGNKWCWRWLRESFFLYYFSEAKFVL